MCHGWVRTQRWAGVPGEFPALKEWVEKIENRDATQAALKIPEQDLVTRVSFTHPPEETLIVVSGGVN